MKPKVATIALIACSGFSTAIAPRVANACNNGPICYDTSGNISGAVQGNDSTSGAREGSASELGWRKRRECEAT